MAKNSAQAESYVFFGTALEPLDEEEILRAKPIRIEDQEVRDEHGRRRFHGAFTGGFSAGYYNTVDTKEGWRPQEFKSSRADRNKRADQRPEDYMDDEDKSAFGIAPQMLRARDEYGDKSVTKQQKKPMYAPRNIIPGLPALHDILQPVKDTIGTKLLKSMGWKPGQGVGQRITKKEKKERSSKMQNLRTYGCVLPAEIEKNLKGSGGDREDTDDEDSEILFAPDDIPSFVAKPKTNTFGLGYVGLNPLGALETKKRDFLLFEPTLAITDKKKKLAISGQAFGVGAFEDEDEDIYAKDDMSRYDFELGGPKKKKSGNMLALGAPDILDGFVRATKRDPEYSNYPPPVLPRDFIPIHRTGKSRFDVKPKTEAELRGLGRHDLDANQRAAMMQDVLDMPPGVTMKWGFVAPEDDETAQKRKSDEIVAKALEQIKKNLAAQKQKTVVKEEPELPAIPTPDQVAAAHEVFDPAREAKIASLKAFVQSNHTPSTFQPFARDADKQFRFEAFNVLSKAGRSDEFHLLQPENMTEWEREREKIEFERAISLYRPLSAGMQNRFTSGGHVEENIEGGLVAQIESFLPTEPPKPKKEPEEKDPAKRAAKRKMFGPLTRSRGQWKPDRLLCLRFNVPNPFPNAGDAPTTSTGIKGATGKFSIFDVLNVVPQASPAFVSTGYETTALAQGLSTGKVPELEWEKAAKGELNDKVEPELRLEPLATVPEKPVESVEEEEEEIVPRERPPMDLFKAIFADSEEENEEEDQEEKEEESGASGPLVEAKSAASQFLSKMELLVDQESGDDDETYGPRLPKLEQPAAAPSSIQITNASVNQTADDGEWIERSKDKDKDKKKKKKKDKDKKKSKSKKEKKTKKRKRRHSDVSSSSNDSDSDRDIKILKKINALKKQNIL